MDHRNNRRPSGNWAKQLQTSYREQQKHVDVGRKNGRMKHNGHDQGTTSSTNDNPDQLLLEMIRKHEKTLACKEKEICTLSTNRIELEEQMESLKREHLKEKERSLSETESEKSRADQFSTQLKCANNNAAQLQAKVHLLEQKLQDRDQDNLKLQQENEREMSELIEAETKYNTQLRLKDHRINQLKGEVKTLSDKRELAEQEIEAQRKLLEMLSLKVKTNTETIKSQEEQNSCLQDRVEDLTEQLLQSNNALQLKCSALEDDLVLEEERVNLLTEANNQLADGKRETDKEIEAQRNLLEELSLQMKTDSEARKVQEEENVRLQHRAEDLTEQLKRSAELLLQSSNAWQLKYSALEEKIREELALKEQDWATKEQQLQDEKEHLLEKYQRCEMTAKQVQEENDVLKEIQSAANDKKNKKRRLSLKWFVRGQQVDNTSKKLKKESKKKEKEEKKQKRLEEEERKKSEKEEKKQQNKEKKKGFWSWMSKKESKCEEASGP